MPVTCIIGLKSNELLIEALKIYLDDSSKNLLYKKSRDGFKTVICNLIQFKNQQKCETMCIIGSKS